MPDGRWKSSGDRIGNYFFVFGGDDGSGQFLNDLWVLPLKQSKNLTILDEPLSSDTMNDAEEEMILGDLFAPEEEEEEESDEASSRGNNDEESDEVTVGDDCTTGKNCHDAAWEGARWVKPTLEGGESSGDDVGPRMPHVRRGHTLTALPETRALVLVGGRQKHEVCLPDTWLLTLPASFDPFAVDAASTGSTSSVSFGVPEVWSDAGWFEAQPLPSACRWGHSSVLLMDPTTQTEIVAVFGGRHEDLDTGEYLYSDELWLFSTTVSMTPSETTSNRRRRSLSLEADTTSEADGAGGTAALLGHWALADTLNGLRPPARDHHASMSTADRKGVYVFGGRTAESMTSAALNDLWLYSVESRSWTQLNPHGYLPTVSPYVDRSS